MEDSLIGTLAKIRLFNDFNLNEIASMAGCMKTKTIPISTMICSEGEIGSEFFVIISGSVRVLKKDKEKKDHELSTLKPGDCFGEMSLIDMQPRSASVQALEETNLAFLTHERFYQMKTDMPEIYLHILLNLAKEFSSRLRTMDNKYIKILGFFF